MKPEDEERNCNNLHINSLQIDYIRNERKKKIVYFYQMLGNNVRCFFFLNKI